MKFKKITTLLMATLLWCGSFALAQPIYTKANMRKTLDKSILSGTYQGKLPCKDCKEINYKVRFFDLNAVEQQSIFIGTSIDTIAINGNYQFLNDSILMISFKDSTQNKFLQKQKLDLIILDNEKKIPVNNGSGAYILKKVSDGSNNKGKNYNDKRTLLKEKKRKQGITFFATSDHSKWDLDVFGKEKVIFNDMAKNKIDTLAIYSWIDNIERGSNTIEAKNNKGINLAINIYNQPCGDSIFGLYNYQVLITENDMAQNGCGDTISLVDNKAQLALNNIWVLQKMGSIIVDKVKAKRVPQMEINTANLVFGGNTDCNSINGKIKLTPTTIKFQNISTTKMACEGSIEKDYLSMLKKVDSYLVIKNRLLLKSGNLIVAIFGRID